MSRQLRLLLWSLVPLLMLVGGAFALIRLVQPETDHLLAGYTTTLAGRTRNQRHNAVQSLMRLDGVTLAPGAEFAFNAQVGSWSRDAGYRKAPVSYNGQLVWAWGGGVCQTSTTLYNAALLAGLDITERHRHHFAPGYVPPGRDAAVAYGHFDLKLRNPYPFPVTMHTWSRGDQLCVELRTPQAIAPAVELVTEVAETRPAPVFIAGSREKSAALVHPGKPGFRVRTWRVRKGDAGVIRELISQDDYPALPRVVAHKPG